MKFVPVHLDFVGPYHTKEVVRLEKVICCSVSEEIRAAALRVLCEGLLKEAGLILDWIAPHEIGKEPDAWNLLESI